MHLLLVKFIKFFFQQFFMINYYTLCQLIIVPIIKYLLHQFIKTRFCYKNPNLLIQSVQLILNQIIYNLLKSYLFILNLYNLKLISKFINCNIYYFIQMHINYLKINECLKFNYQLYTRLISYPQVKKICLKNLMIKF